MNEHRAQRRDSALIRQDYEAVRAWLLGESERRYREAMGVDLGPVPDTPEFKKAEKDVKQALRRVGTSLGVRLDQLFRDSVTQERCRVDEAHAAAARAYYDAVVAPRIAADAAILPERRRHRRDRDESGQPGRQPVPYAVLVSGSEAPLVGHSLPGREVHGSWRWAEAQFDSPDWIRDLKLDVVGNGKGLHGLFPDYNNGNAVDVTWLFYWEPKYLAGEHSPGILAEKKAYNWSCEPIVDFLGAVYVYAWDEWWNSKEAGVRLDLSVMLAAIPVGAQSSAVIPFQNVLLKNMSVCSLSGQNILRFVHLDSPYSLGSVSPKPDLKFNAHWIAVTVRAIGWTRGDGSHVTVDLASGNNDVFLNYMQVWEEDV